MRQRPAFQRRYWGFSGRRELGISFSIRRSRAPAVPPSPPIWFAASRRDLSNVGDVHRSPESLAQCRGLGYSPALDAACQRSSAQPGNREGARTPKQPAQARHASLDFPINRCDKPASYRSRFFPAFEGSYGSVGLADRIFNARIDGWRIDGYWLTVTTFGLFVAGIALVAQLRTRPHLWIDVVLCLIAVLAFPAYIWRVVHTVTLF